MSAIVIENLSKMWGEAAAVDRISFEASEGELTILLGPSGCGKSTTLRLIAGLESPTSGRIFIGGRDVTDATPAMRELSMVFQSYALFPHLNVAENILFGLKVRKVPKVERNKRLRRVADLLGLSALLDRRPSQLSGGQQQRVALGRAIIAEKQVCLMDEPLSNLDAKLRHEMRQEIRALQRKLGISMVYVTHDQAEAMSMADRVVLLRDGRIEQNAAPETIYQRPATAFAARFIGTPPMNIIQLASHSGGTPSGGLEMLDLPEEDLCLGVRPEDIEIGGEAGIPATVSSLDYLGADSIVDCRIGEQTISVRTPGRIRIEPGTQVNLVWSRENVHFFQTSTGQRRDDIHLNGAP